MLVETSVFRDGRSIELPGYHKTKSDMWIPGLIIVSSLLILCSVLYTYGVVATILAAVEAPQVPLNSLSDYDQPADGMGSAFGDVVSKPITTDLITVKTCFRQQAGHWCRYRGLSMALTYRLAKAILVYVAPLQHTNILGWFLYSALIDTLLSNLHVALIHIIISQPSHKRFYQRNPGLSSWMTIAPIAAISSFVTSAGFYLPLSLIRGFGKTDGPQPIAKATGLFQIGIIVISAALLYFVGVAPA